MPEDKGFLKCYNDDKSLVFRIQTMWEDEYFQLHVFENNNAWFALVTKDLITRLAEQNELERKMYLQTLKEYFTVENDSFITFNIIKNQFVMYKRIKSADFRVKYFFVDLEKLDYQGAIESYIDDSEAKEKDLLKQVELASEQISSLQKELEATQRKNDEFIDIKVKADLKIYSSFTLILNEKKQRIQYLTELLTHRKDDTENKSKLQSKSVSVKKVKKSGTSILRNDSLASTSKPIKSDSDLSEEYDTDVENELKVKTSIENAVIAPTSTSLDFLGGSSPPPSLPKRAKMHIDANTIDSISESQMNEIMEIMDSIDKNSKIESKNKIKETTDPIKANPEVDEDIDYKAQPHTSTTQDLLDRM